MHRYDGRHWRVYMQSFRFRTQDWAEASARDAQSRSGTSSSFYALYDFDRLDVFDAAMSARATNGPAQAHGASGAAASVRPSNARRIASRSHCMAGSSWVRSCQCMKVSRGGSAMGGSTMRSGRLRR